MSAIENATNFFHACDSAKGWDECSQYVAEGASFHAQSEPLVDITTVEGYAIWMAGFGENVVPGSSYEIHTSAYDDASKTAIFFATFTGKHTGDGGPIPPTNKETNTHYVYIFTMNDDDKIKKMQKVWNAPWALKELGWM
jgi:SnoaL-like domain